MQADALSHFSKDYVADKEDNRQVASINALFNSSKLPRNTLSLKRTPLQSALK